MGISTRSKRNIFSSLNRYAQRQEENFLTESFAYVLESLQQREPALFLDLFQLLSGLKKDVDSEKVSIRTQESTDVGTPDLVFELAQIYLIYIEIKHDSPLGDKQLERYYKELHNNSHEHKHLVLLTRSKHSMQGSSFPTKKYHQVSWYEVSGLLSGFQISDVVANFVVQEFLGFLEKKSMSMQRIGWEYIRGVPALHHLLNMLRTALAETLPEVAIRNNIGWEWAGIHFGDGKNWIGVFFDNSLELVLEKGGAVDPKPRITTNLEESPFFSLDAGRQLEFLIAFIRNGIRDLDISFSEEK